jgi:hypothetical protein
LDLPEDHVAKMMQCLCHLLLQLLSQCCLALYPASQRRGERTVQPALAAGIYDRADGASTIQSSQWETHTSKKKEVETGTTRRYVCLLFPYKLW